MKRKVLLIGGNSLVGQAITEGLGDCCQIVPTAGHHTPENGYQLAAEEPDKLMEILSREDPEIVVSSIRGDYQAQMKFHRMLAQWIAEKQRRLLYVSTANVFDGDLSRPWTESDVPMPGSEYGCFKRDCEVMLGNLLGKQLIIFRLAAVWNAVCPRVQQLKLHSRSEEPHPTYPDYTINVTFAKQIGEYARYILDYDLCGIFHVGTVDTIDYSSFERMVCQALQFRPPQFTAETETGKKVFAILPARKEIPDSFQMTVSDVLAALSSQIVSEKEL
ncbi:MAG: sugar nucleotide-binding protein [Lachnospiraceae bacterium]|nr:sugar nucleotide-binding protein [Lachnospiraceae bacterium]MCM1239066.1 sugar nucleotide-binding protein [Lachnospiraceae bacterium]